MQCICRKYRCGECASVFAILAHAPRGKRTGCSADPTEPLIDAGLLCVASSCLADPGLLACFADGRSDSLKGAIQDQGPFVAGKIKNDGSWAPGARSAVGCAECPFLRERRFLQLALDGHDPVQQRGTALRSGLHTDGFNRGAGSSAAV